MGFMVRSVKSRRKCSHGSNRPTDRPTGDTYQRFLVVGWTHNRWHTWAVVECSEHWLRVPYSEHTCNACICCETRVHSLFTTFQRSVESRLQRLCKTYESWEKICFCLNDRDIELNIITLLECKLERHWELSRISYHWIIRKVFEYYILM